MSYIGITETDIKLRFIHIPKCAGMSIRSWYQKTFKGQQVIDKNHAPRFYFNNDCFFWTIVRNPYSRAISWYKYRGYIIIKRRKRHEQYRNEISDWEKGINYWLEKRFDTEWFDPDNGPNMYGPVNDYFRISTPMVKWLEDKDKNLSINKIIKLDNINEDIKEIYNIANTNIVMPIKNESPKKYQVNSLSKNSKKIIETFYKEDFELLDY